MTTLAPHQQRVVTERDELAERLTKLRAFLGSVLFRTKLDASERVLLRAQAHHMQGYLWVLDERIKAFAA